MSPQSMLTPEAVARALAVRDLTDPSQGPHAVQKVLDAAVQAVARASGCEVVVHRGSPIVPAADHFERLRHPPEAERDPRGARRVSAGEVLRARTTAMLPGLLRSLAAAPPADVLLVAPGVVYRREGDRARAEEGHQVDLWRVRRGAPFSLRDLARMIGAVAGAAAPGLTLSAVPEPLPWVADGRRVDVRVRGEWIGVAECGVVVPDVLRDAGWPEDATALAMTLDLDRLTVLAKGMDDVRTLRSRDPRVAPQLLDLAPYVPAPRPWLRPDLRGRAPVRECGSLDEVRSSIDDVDGRIVKLLAERRGYVLQAARFKKGDEVRVPAREEAVVAHVREVAREAGIEADVVEEVYRQLMGRFVELERAAKRHDAPKAPTASAG
jgi:phenylalanyl-tRNA synthetase alpha chain